MLLYMSISFSLLPSISDRVVTSNWPILRGIGEGIGKKERYIAHVHVREGEVGRRKKYMKRRES